MWSQPSLINIQVRLGKWDFLLSEKCFQTCIRNDIEFPAVNENYDDICVELRTSRIVQLIMQIWFGNENHLKPLWNNESRSGAVMIVSGFWLMKCSSIKILVKLHNIKNNSKHSWKKAKKKFYFNTSVQHTKHEHTLWFIAGAYVESH